MSLSLAVRLARMRPRPALATRLVQQLQVGALRQGVTEVSAQQAPQLPAALAQQARNASLAQPERPDTLQAGAQDLRRHVSFRWKVSHK